MAQLKPPTLVLRWCPYGLTVNLKIFIIHWCARNFIMIAMRSKVIFHSISSFLRWWYHLHKMPATKRARKHIISCGTCVRQPHLHVGCCQRFLPFAVKSRSEEGGHWEIRGNRRRLTRHTGAREVNSYFVAGEVEDQWKPSQCGLFKKQVEMERRRHHEINVEW